MEFRLELIPVPVSDVDRAKKFYVEKAGFTCDLDFSPGEEFRVVQLTPPGSACSIAIGIGVVDTAPGSVRGLHLVVPDIHEARAALVERGMEIGEVEDMSAPGKPTISYAWFSDPDGNTWTLQQLPS
ncbi:VOC family protein [Nonomuraea mangrovi]|uniref:VOC family protein n=1 Tax=Nonomuraea mangrovi TaxID=2316207 RepID=A0ABW4TD79_9ACTN